MNTKQGTLVQYNEWRNNKCVGTSNGGENGLSGKKSQDMTFLLKINGILLIKDNEDSWEWVHD